MYVLGIGTGFVHDGSAALIKDGAVLSAVEEERFDRVKHGIGYPHRAIGDCLSKEGIELADVDYIAFYSPKKNTVFYAAAKTKLRVVAHEIGHVVAEHYFAISPPPKIHEVLAQYAESHIMD